MQKKALALAVAGALGAPGLALAQTAAGTSTVQIFGTMYLEYGIARQGQAAAAAAGTSGGQRQTIDMLQNPGSEIGFKGEEALGGGLSAWFQCTSTADFRSSAVGGDSYFCSRNSALGFKGPWGNLFAGRWDTPFKRTTSPTMVGVNDTGFWGIATILTGNSTSHLDNSTRAGFRRRQGNTIFYDSPVFGGFQVLGAVSVPNSGTQATTGVTASKPRLYSLGAQYSAGPLYVSAAYDIHKEFNCNTTTAAAPAISGFVPPCNGASVTTTGSQDDKGWQVGASYRIGPVQVGGLYTRQKFQTAGAATPAGAASPATTLTGGSASATFPAWTLGVDWNIVGAHSLRAGYSRTNNAKGNATIVSPVGNNTMIAQYRPAPCFGYTAATVSCTGTSANMWQIRYVYAFSKRTEFNFGYVKLNNGSNASYTLSGLGGSTAGGASPPTAGTDQSAWALAVKHTF